MDNLVIGIDIGTHKVCTIVAQIRPEAAFIIGAGIEGTRGMKAGLVSDLEALTRSISGSVYKASNRPVIPSSVPLSASPASISAATTAGARSASTGRAAWPPTISSARCRTPAHRHPPQP